MIVLQTIDLTSFRYNGIKYAKNFMCIVQGTTHISVYNAFDTSMILIPSVSYNEIQVDGIIYSTIVDLINVLTPLLFYKSFDGAEFTIIDGVGEIGYIPKWTNTNLLGKSKFYEDEFGVVLDGNAGENSPSQLNSKFAIVDGFHNFSNNFGIVWGGGDKRPTIIGNKDENKIDTIIGNKVAISVSNNNTATLSINSTSTYILPKYGCSGEVVYFGKDDEVNQGMLYYLTQELSWKLTNAEALESAYGMLAIALGKSVSDGMLIKGTATFDLYREIRYRNGLPLYVSDEGDGIVSNRRPRNKYIRIIGYCIDSENGTIYFNPDNIWIGINGDVIVPRDPFPVAEVDVLGKLFESKPTP